LPEFRRKLGFAACACLLFSAEAGAQGICSAPPATETENTAPPSISDRIVIDAGRSVYDTDGTFRFLDGIDFSYRNGRVSADRAIQSADSSAIEVLDDVRLTGDGFEVFADDARLDRTSEEMEFTGAGINLTNESAQSARARAERITVTSAELFSLSELSFTTCPEDNVDWEFRARSFVIDQEAGVGILRGATLRIGPVPVLWSPFFSVPTNDQRKSGFLTPTISKRDRTGFDLTVPYYLNLAPNYDLLLEPRLMEKRGAQIGSRFRYLLPRGNGQLEIEDLPNDRVLHRSRHYVNFGHESAFGERWSLDARIANVSDAAYFEDLGDNLGAISQTHLDRYVDLTYHGPRWSLVTRAQEYQTIDTLIDAADRPYERRPQMVFSGDWGDRLLDFESSAEAVKFDRSIGDTGWRVDSIQKLSLRFGRSGYYITPAVGFRQTNYRIDATPGSPARSLSRGLPVTSIDAGLRFERTVTGDRSWIQTIEPRVLYVRVPYEDQSELPVFDTILPDFNLVQLFREYLYVGGDRVADTNQISVGMTTRLIESASGRERVSATVGQTRYRNPRRILLPGESPGESTRSNYVAEVSVNLSPMWNLDVGYQWNGETRKTVRSETRFEFRPEEDRLFGFGYRQRKGLLEQGDVSIIWPIGEHWRLIGQYSYSLLEKKPLERLSGIEYEACCWRLRVTDRRYIVRSTGQTDSSIALQFELKGLSRDRTTPEQLLGRGILQSQRRNQF
jgi:LPS-assembly protein